MRERALKVVLVIVGLVFVAGVYPLITSIREGWQANKEDALPMGISLYVTQGIFLLLATRDPLANRGVITLAAWLNIAHGAVMTTWRSTFRTSDKVSLSLPLCSASSEWR